MSGVSGVSGSNSYLIQQYQQNLFNQIDSNSDGSISQTELEQAVTNAGGTTQAADALYAKLDPNNTGSVSEQQFANILPGPPFSGEMQSQMIGYQAQGWPDSLSADDSASIDGSSSATGTSSSATDPGSAMAQNLFSADRQQWRRIDQQDRTRASGDQCRRHDAGSRRALRPARSQQHRQRQ